MQEFINGLVQIFIAIIIISVVISIYATIMMWKIFKKANKPGWVAAIPFYNLYILTEITWGNGWLFLIIVSDGIAYTMSLPKIILSIIDIIVLVFSIMTIVRLARAFGKDNGFAAGLVFLGLIFITILAFDSSEYLGAPKKDVQPVTPNNENTNTATSTMVPPTPSVPIQPTLTPPTPIPTNNIGSVQPQTTEAQPVEENKTATVQTTTYCTNCGATLQPGTEFCQNCGNKVTN